MRNPTETHDTKILKEEPLRSFFADVALQHRHLDPIVKEKRRLLILELNKTKNIEAVKTWLELAFPVQHAPLGKTIRLDYTTVGVFLDFHWFFYRSRADATKFLHRERDKRGWPEKLPHIVEKSGSRTKRTDLTGRDKRDEMHSAPKPINPSTSHVTTKKYSGLHFSRKREPKAENITPSLIDARQHDTPHLTPTLITSAFSQPPSSSTVMQTSITVSDSRSPSSLIECESEAFATCATPAQTGVETKIQESAPGPKSKDPLSIKNKVVVTKPTKAGSLVKKSDNNRGTSARFRGNYSMESDAMTDIRGHSSFSQNAALQEGFSQTKTVPSKQKTGLRRKDSISVAKVVPPEAMDLKPVSAKDVPLELDSGSMLNSSTQNQEHPKNNIPPRKKISSGSQSSQSTSISLTRQSHRNKKVLTGAIQVSASAPKSGTVQNGAYPESETKGHTKAEIDQREKLRPRMHDSSENPKHVLSSKPSEGMSGIPTSAVKRKRKSQTSDANKKPRISTSAVPDLRGGTKAVATIQNVERTPPSRPAGLSGKLILSTKGKDSTSVTRKKSSLHKKNLRLKVEDPAQDSNATLLDAGPISTVPKTPPSGLKRKRSPNAETSEDSSVQNKKDQLSSHHEPALKKSRKSTSLSEKKRNRPPDENRRRSLRNKNALEVPSPRQFLPQLKNDVKPNSVIETIPSPMTDIREGQPLEPTKQQTPAKSPIPSVSLTTTTSSAPPAMNDAEDIRLEIVGHLKEEAFEVSQLSAFQSSPILAPQLQENDEEMEFTLYDDLFSSEEDDTQFTFPDDHPDNFRQLPKPPLRILPPIWAESRQEICESFDWFRSYQGGVYHAHNVAKGYLLSAFPASRDRYEHGGRLIISHGGGKAESIHSNKGRLESQPATDQLARDKSVRALYDNFLNNRPLALVMDDRYALFPYDLKAKNVTYAVLGFYTIADAWAEYQPSSNESGHVIRYKFAFRWCDDQGPPWWEQQEDGIYPEFNDEANTEAPRTLLRSESAPEPANVHDERINMEGYEDDKHFLSPQVIKTRECPKRKCACCSKAFSQVFSLSWVCLNPECPKFWKLGDGQFLPDCSSYNSRFLELGPSRPIPVGFGSLEPKSALFLPLDNITTYAFTRGFHCHNCGRLSCRDQWEKWECRNAACQASLKISCPPREATSLLYQTPSLTFKDYSLNPISDIIQLPSASFRHEKGRGLVQTFVLPHESAKIHHIQAGNFLGRQEADSVFLDYQRQATSGALRFRRWPMRAHKCRGSLLTNYFSQNSGEPYKYVGGDANTVPFESAPGAVVRARDLIQKRVMQALHTPAHFNEVLSAAYMERQKMAFHSDNEVGLGPLVAGLSLGSPALMHFRLHAKHDTAREKRGILLSIVLRHGDILVMDGAAVQEYYEHTVVPTNFRIAATARQIGANHG